MTTEATPAFPQEHNATTTDTSGALTRPQTIDELREHICKVLRAINQESVATEANGNADRSQESVTPAHLEDVCAHLPAGFTEEGLAVFLLGDTTEELGGSAWARIIHAYTEGSLEAADEQLETGLSNVLHALSDAEGPDGLPIIRGAYLLSDGGVLQALVDSSLRFGVGGSFDMASIAQASGLDDFTVLFSRSPLRAMIAVPEGAAPVVSAAAQAEEVTFTRLGTTGGDILAVTGADLLSDMGNGAGWIVDLAELQE